MVLSGLFCVMCSVNLKLLCNDFIRVIVMCLVLFMVRWEIICRMCGCCEGGCGVGMGWSWRRVN